MRLVMNDVAVKFHLITGYTQSDEMTFFWMSNDNSWNCHLAEKAKLIVCWQVLYLFHF